MDLYYKFMKKYLQISVVGIIFVGLLLIRNFSGGDEDEINVGEASSQVINSTQVTKTQNSSSNQNNSSTFAANTPADTTGKYKDGTYLGTVEDAYYGNVQVKVVISDGKIVDATLAQYPNDNHTSIRINSLAEGYLKAEAIDAQSANINNISGASLTSAAFKTSLASALSQAQN